MLQQHKMDSSLLVNDISTSYNNVNKTETPSDFSGTFVCRRKIHDSVIHEKGYTLSSFKVTSFKQATISQRNAGKGKLRSEIRIYIYS